MSRRDEINELLGIHQRRLRKLNEQRASFGMHAPVHLSIEIEDVEEQIERLGAELRELESIATSASQNVLSANKSERIDWGQETQIGAHPSECRLGKDNFRGPPQAPLSQGFTRSSSARRSRWYVNAT